MSKKEFRANMSEEVEQVIEGIKERNGLKTNTETLESMTVVYKLCEEPEEWENSKNVDNMSEAELVTRALEIENCSYEELLRKGLRLAALRIVATELSKNNTYEKTRGVKGAADHLIREKFNEYMEVNGKMPGLSKLKIMSGTNHNTAKNWLKKNYPNHPDIQK